MVSVLQLYLDAEKSLLLLDLLLLSIVGGLQHFWLSLLDELLVVAGQLLESLWLVLHRVCRLSLCEIKLEWGKMWRKLLADRVLERGQAYASIEGVEHVLWLDCLASHQLCTWTVADQVSARGVCWRLRGEHVTSSGENHELNRVARNFSGYLVRLSAEQLLL